MIYPIIREDKKTKLLIEYIPEPEYKAEEDITVLNLKPVATITEVVTGEISSPIGNILQTRPLKKFEPGYVFRYFILDNNTYVDVKVVSNTKGDLELLCRGFRETYGEPRHFYDEKVVMGMTYYDKYIESVLKRFALKALQL